MRAFAFVQQGYNYSMKSFSIFLLILVLLAQPAPALSPGSALQGYAYGPFRAGQSPALGIFPTAEQIEQDMPRLKTDGNAVRTYGCVNLEAIAAKTAAAGLSLAQGAWLDGAAGDAAEMTCATNLGQTNSHIVLLIAGNESILRGTLTVDDVCAAVKKLGEDTGLSATTAEPWTVWRDNPALAACMDVLLVHIHPYWDCQSPAQAAAYITARYNELKTLYPTKRVILGEVGYPSAGPAPAGCPAALPSPQGQAQVVQEFLAWAHANAVEYFFFEAFDEPWKCTGGEGVECHWGAYTTTRAPKPAASAFHRSLFLPALFRP